MYSRDQALGLHGERWAIQELSDRGHTVTVPDFSAPNCDLICDGLCVEVKYARPTTRLYRGKSRNIFYTRWQWNIHQTAQAMQHDWGLILIAEDAENYLYPFILPGNLVGHREQVQITSHPTQYGGWLAQWLNRWDIIPYLVNGVYRDGGPLFHELESVAA